MTRAREMPVPVHPSRLVDREREFSLLQTLLARVAEGESGVAVVVGEAGVGKSRLVAEILGAARLLRLDVCSAGCEELERHRPFGVLQDALACRSDSEDPRRRAVAGLLASAGGMNPSTEFSIVDAFVDLVDRLAATGPLLLALEDLQWADTSSLVAIRAIARGCRWQPLAIVVDLRPYPLSPDLQALRRSLVQDAFEVVLEPLDGTAVIELVTDLLTARPGPLLERRLAAAGGNPLFVGELLAALRDEGAISIEGGVADTSSDQLPPNLRLTIIRRISFLPEPTLAVLRQAALLGSGFTLDDLATTTARPAQDIWDQLEPAMRSGFLGSRTDRLEFRHDLLREAIYEDIPLGARRTLHLEAARSLAAAHAPLRQVAEQFALGDLDGDTEAADWLVRAAREDRVMSPTVAVHLYEDALRLIPQGDRRRLEIVADMLDPMVWAGRSKEAEALARQALGRPLPSELEARFRGELVRILEQLGRYEDQENELEQLLMRPGSSDPDRLSYRAQLLVNRTRRGQVGDDAEIDAVVVEATRTGDVWATWNALKARTDALMVRGESAAALSLMDRGFDAARRLVQQGHARGHLALGIQQFDRAMTLLHLNRLDEARVELALLLQRSERSGSVGYLPTLHLFLGRCHFDTAAWDEASVEAEAAISAASEHGMTAHVVEPRGLLGFVAFHRGDTRSAAAFLLEGGSAEPSFQQPELSMWGAALLLEAQGKLDAALATLAALVDRGYLAPAPDMVRLARRLGDHDAARGAVDRAEGGAARSDLASARGRALRCRGLLEQDAETLQRAAGAFLESPLAVEAAFACEDAGMALADAGRVDDARVLFERALDIYGRAGAARCTSRVYAAMRARSIRRRPRATRRRPSFGWEGLTDAEHQVARLVAEGLTNREIGDRLFISRTTVATHLSHIFTKLGIRSRMALAAEAARHSDAGR